MQDEVKKITVKLYDSENIHKGIIQHISIDWNVVKLVEIYDLLSAIVTNTPKEYRDHVWMCFAPSEDSEVTAEYCRDQTDREVQAEEAERKRIEVAEITKLRELMKKYPEIKD